MRKSLGLAAVAAVAVSIVPATAETGDPTLCYEVTRTGTVGPPVHVGPICVPFYDGPVNCQPTTVTTTPLNVITISWCVPR
ncbi:MAG TPA: hypothetical protein VF519_15805 [Mycobacteriales bacterium]|jgi:hypothetical protein